MSSLEMIHLDLECGGHRGSAEFSQVEESSYPQFYPNADGPDHGYDFDHKIEQVLSSARASSMVGSQSWVETKNEAHELKVHSEKVERDCRICQMSLDFDDSDDQESGVPIELGCSCKDDLAAAHKHCAEAWFKIKGNKTCEICNSVAHNVVGPNDIESAEHANDTNAASAPSSSTRETRTCLNGHRFLNFLLACMVFAFVISWLFHFNIPS